MSEPKIQASYARSLLRLGRQITLQRIVGQAPNTTIVSASVLAMVQGDLPDTDSVSKTGYGAREPGGISQTDRSLIVMASDLIAQQFPLPVRKNDRIAIGTTRFLNIVSVDEDTRRAAGAIVLKAAGVA